MMQKTILITGCSSGIGLRAATLLKQRGYRVFASARKAVDVEKLITQGFESVQLDVRHSDSIQQAIDYILTKTNGKLDALFNNAGFMQAGAIEDLTPELIQAQFATNVFGPIELTRLILPMMRQQGHGRIIQNSSILGLITLPYYGAYNASKFALEGFSNTLRQELHGTNIFVSVINPGPITSQLRDSAYATYQQTIENKAAIIHREAYENLENNYFKRKGKYNLHQAPDAVVKKLIHALESKHPKAHYIVGFPAQALAFLRRVLPDCAMDVVLRKVQ